MFSSLFSFQQNLHLADASRSSKYSLVCDAQQVEVIFYLKILLLITRKKNQAFWSFPSFWNSDSKLSNILVPSVSGSGNLTWTEPCLMGALDALTKAC